MKTIKTLAITIAMLLGCITTNAQTLVNGIWYSFNSNGTASVAQYQDGNKYSGDIVIPESVTYNGKEYTVTSIGYRAFSNCSSLTSINIPDGVTSIGGYAFYGCSSLTSINIPDGVTSIGNEAFYNCSSLTDLHISSIAGWFKMTFSNYSSHPLYCNSNEKNLYLGSELVADLVIPEGICTIPEKAFYKCSNIKSVSIPTSVTSIGSSAFSGCSSLTSINIPDGVTSIGNSTFWGCSSLTSINIPDGVTSIGNEAFYSCSSLTSINLPDGVTSIGNEAFYSCSSLTSINIPVGVTSIGNSAFYNCSSLTSINLPDGVTSIGNSAFYKCSSLTLINLPDGVTSIGHSAFYNCSSLTSINLPDGVTSIGNSAFCYCSSLTSINLPDGVTSIGNSTFWGCSSLTSINIPDGVTSIGGGAFDYCSSLTSINIPDGVTSIGNDAFSGCSSLTDLHISSIAGWFKIMFVGSSSHPLYCNSNEKNLYLGSELVIDLVIPEGICTIPEKAFYKCSNIKSVSIPTSVTSIGGSAFSGCSSLTSINIPDGVTSIGGGAFSGCSSLTTINIPDGVTSIGNSTFWGCSSLTSINIPDGVTSIEAYAFRNCSSLTSINLPDGVTRIEYEAFSGCSSLTSINIPDGVTSIGGSAFYKIPKVVLKATTPPVLTTSGNAVTTPTVIIVPASAYDTYCADPTWAKLANLITKDDACQKTLILTAASDESALEVAAGDENLKFITDLTISGTINSYDFMIMRNKMPLLRNLDLSQASIVYNAYKHYEYYNSENNKLPGYGLYNCKLVTLSLPQNITTIGICGLQENCYLKEIVVPEGVTSIENSAFYNCNWLETASLPNSLESIGSNAFNGCSSLKSVNIPEGITDIERYTFSGCSELTSIVLPPTIRNIREYAFSSPNITEIRIPSSVRTIANHAFSGCSNLNDIYVYTVEPFSIGQGTFKKSGNNFVGTLHAPKVSFKKYYYDTQWSQFTKWEEFDDTYDNFYLVGDKVLDESTGNIRGDEEKNPDAEMGQNSGLIVEDDVKQELGNADIENGGSIIVNGSGYVNADKLNFRINVNGGRWYFFCFPFDVKAEDIRCESGAEWVFRYYDGAERAKSGKGGWKNVTADGEGNFLKAATGYIFQCSKSDVLVLSAKNGKIKKEDKYNELVEHVTTNTQNASWNFVGNPYLSYYEVNSEDYSAPLTVWDGSKYVAIRPGDDDYQLAPFEAFFVQKPEGKNKVNYSSERQKTKTQATQAAANARVMRAKQAIDPNRLLVNITLSNGENTDRTRVVFNNSADMKYETACDAAKFSTQGVPQLYTLDANAVKYAINERPMAQGNVSVGYSVPAKGNYTVAATRMDTGMLLMDNLTGTVHDLTKGEYQFTSEAGTFDKRFTLIVKGDATAIENLQSEENADNEPIYNIKGQQVTDMEQNDVYIKNNRKVIK